VIKVFAMRKSLYLIALVIAGMVGGNGIIFCSAYAEQMRELPVNTGSSVTPERRSGGCVESVPVMRKKHMDFLFHQRDNTMHYGIRTKPHSLKGCVNCHVQRDEQGRNVPINAPNQFCQDCHQYVAVNIDCFQCHVATPDDAVVR